MVNKGKNFRIMLQKEELKKTAEATDDLIGNKISDRTTKVSKHSPKNSSETFKNEHDKEIPNVRHILLLMT